MEPGGGRGINCTWEHCNKSFNRKSDLCRHYRIHTKERPYRCTVKGCNKAFIQRSALTVHLRTHTGEKPHVCDHRGCHKAFSDSSSLARHRRIHTGKRPYICQEPTCRRDFCRKVTLTKHQKRCHPSESMNRLPSEDAMSEHLYQGQVAVPIPYKQYPLLQQPCYSHTPTPTHGFHPHQSLHITPVLIQDPPPIVTRHIPITSPVDVLRAQQHYMQPVLQPQQQQYDPGHQEYLPPETQEPYYTAPTADGAPLMVTDIEVTTSHRLGF